jgi:putative toxin-antitoxin system antitoxin component (TIGR02293 family)
MGESQLWLKRKGSRMHVISDNCQTRILHQRKKQAGNEDFANTRLDPLQSAIPLQFAKVLEHATVVFGTLAAAEEWLERPCRYLDGFIPLDLVDNPLGLQVLEDYLDRIKHGAYQ